MQSSLKHRNLRAAPLLTNESLNKNSPAKPCRFRLLAEGLKFWRLPLAAKLSLALLLINLPPAFATPSQPDSDSETNLEIVVSANRLPSPLEQTASSVTVIDQEEIKDTGAHSVTDALRLSPSVDIARSGGLGGNSAVFMRGANSEHTLVLLDGIELNNPITPTRAYNFSDLATEGLDRIEILRGPQSTLYGSNAMGGVINLITKKGQGPTKIEVSEEAGSYQSFLERAALSGSRDQFNYSFEASRRDFGGISAAAQNLGNSERDRYGATTVASRLGYTPSEHLELSLISRLIDSRADADNQGGAGGDDPNRLVANRQVFARLQADTSFLDHALTQTFGFAYSEQHLSDDNDPDLAHPLDSLKSHYSGGLTKFDFQNNYSPWEILTVTAGYENKEERGSSAFSSTSAFGPYEDSFSPRSASTNSYYGQAQLKLFERWYSTLGGRIDDRSDFGSKGTWRVGSTLQIPETLSRVFATLGTGFKAPSLFQLYSLYGNSALSPEKSVGFDAGIEQTIIPDSLSLRVGYFKNRFDNLIDFDPNSFIFENIARARTQGFESSLEWKVCSEWTLNAGYSYLDTKDLETDQQLLRRARHQAHALVKWRPTDRWTFILLGQYIGKRIDNDFSTYPATRQVLGGYPLFNLSARFQVNSNLELFARVENIFDRDYQEVLGYGTYGASAYGGATVRW